MTNKKISDKVVQRLPKYYRYLQELCLKGIKTISSNEISKSLHITASQVRQDLSQFGGFGRQGFGYDVEYLKEKMKEILGLTKTHTAIIVGGGRIGQALANYKGFKKESVIVKAIFDVELSHVEKVDGIEVLHISQMEEFVKQNKIDVAIISVQKEQAETVAKKTISAGVKAIWNFAPIDLYFGEEVACENINMSESLMRLLYKSKGLYD